MKFIPIWKEGVGTNNHNNWSVESCEFLDFFNQESSLKQTFQLQMIFFWGGGLKQSQIYVIEWKGVQHFFLYT